MQYQLHEKYKFYYRENIDHIDEDWSSYIKIIESKKWNLMLDVGANIGQSAVIAKTAGVDVISYEPSKDSFEVLMYNAKKYNFRIVNKAVYNKTTTLPLYISSKWNACNSTKFKTAYNTPNIDVETVDALNFLDVIHLHKPDLLKIDIEGGEYDIDLSNLPSFIKGIIIEIHNRDGIQNSGKATLLCNILENQFETFFYSTYLEDDNFWVKIFHGTRN
jgi:FkbM family methyltransferase